MKKKLFSLALALAMCLGLTLPAFAAEAGDTTVTVTDSTGFTHTLKLSNPIASVDTIDYNGGTTVYQIPEGTTVVPVQPAGSKDTSETFIKFNLTDEHFVSYLDNSVGQDYGPDDDPDGPPQWNWYPHQGEEGEIFTNGAPLGIGIHEIECRNSWYAGAGVDSVTENIYFQVVKADAPTEPTTPVEPEQPTEPADPVEPVVKTAEPTNDKFYVDGELAVPTAYKIGGSNYFKIRDVAALLNGTDAQFSVDYDNDTRIVYLVTGQSYEKKSSDLAGVPAGSKEAISTNDSTYVNGEKVELTVYKIGGSNYYKLRDLGKALGFNVGYTDGYGAFIETDKPYEG